MCYDKSKKNPKFKILSVANILNNFYNRTHESLSPHIIDSVFHDNSVDTN